MRIADQMGKWMSTLKPWWDYVENQAVDAVMRTVRFNRNNDRPCKTMGFWNSFCV